MIFSSGVRFGNRYWEGCGEEVDGGRAGVYAKSFLTSLAAKTRFLPPCLAT